MTRGKKAEVIQEVTDPPEEAKAPVDLAAEEFSDEVKEDSVNPELAQHVRDLVGLFFQHEVQALEQRIADLELLVGQPQDAVQFVTPPVAPVWSNDLKQNPGNPDEVPWYQPSY
jgi:hypothetical protein